jgi:acyl-coenzyme A thioesterase PaaI-like protein
MPDHLYTREGRFFAPSKWTGSPWSPASQHGAPVNALFMRAAERIGSELGMRVARLTVDILKPVPAEPLAVTAEFRRRGRRLAVVDAAMTRADGDAPVATARFVALRERDELPATFAIPGVRPSGPDGIPGRGLIPPELRDRFLPGFHLSVEVRQSRDDSGAIAWITSPLELVAGEAMSPLERCAAICDLTAVVSGQMQPGPGAAGQAAMMLNTDTTIHFLRPPVGEWFAFSNSFIADRNGTGFAEVALHDEMGALGRSAQTMTSSS